MEDSTASRRRASLYLTFFTALTLTFLAQDAANGSGLAQRIFPHSSKQPETPGESLAEATALESVDMETLRRQLEPKKILLNNNGELSPHQFLHLHHMKTGGTSMDGLIRCGQQRLNQANLQFNYSNIHECGEGRYNDCKRQDANNRCLQGIQNAGILSYCAPLMDLEDPFGWERDAIPAAVTVFRHPVNRVWSMFRFQTKSCYGCRNLTDIYADIDAGNGDKMRTNCRLQLLNHQTRNLLSRDVALKNEQNPESDAAIQEAIENMRSVFAMIGLTEDMASTAAMAAKVFPWLAPQVDWASAVSGPNAANLPNSSSICEMPYSNGSPSNNHCSADGTGHWDLPDHPDEETTRVILEHNQADLKLYEAAVQRFDLQKQILGL